MKLFLRSGLCFVLLSAGCGPGSNTTPGACSPPTGGTPCTMVVCPGTDAAERIGRMLNGAAPGSSPVVCLGSGTFVLNDTINLGTSGARLRGAGRSVTVLDFSGAPSSLTAGINVSAGNVTIEDLTVRGTPFDGVYANGVRDLTVRKVDVYFERRLGCPGEGPDGGMSSGPPPARLSGAYGIYPVNSERVLIEDCEVVGAPDAGIYLGHSRVGILRNNLAHGNVAGIEVENSSDVEVRGNRSFNNAIGISVHVLPEGSPLDADRILLTDNIIVNNNGPNFGCSLLRQTPSGLGVVVSSPKNVQVVRNVIQEHNFMGIAIASWCSLTQGMDCPPYTGPRAAFVGIPRNISIQENNMRSNGMNPPASALPDPALVPAFRGVDVGWDGFSGTINPQGQVCVQSGVRYFKYDALGGFMNTSTTPPTGSCSSDAPMLPMGWP